MNYEEISDDILINYVSMVTGDKQETLKHFTNQIDFKDRDKIRKRINNFVEELIDEYPNLKSFIFDSLVLLSLSNVKSNFKLLYLMKLFNFDKQAQKIKSMIDKDYNIR